MAKWNNTDHRRGDNFRRGNTRDSKSGGSGKKGGGAHYEPNNKALGIFAAVVVGITLIGVGPGAIFDAFGTAADVVKDTVVDSAVDAVKDSISSSVSNKNSSSSSNKSNKGSSKSNKEYKDNAKKQSYSKTDYDIDIDKDTIEDTFDFLKDLREALAEDGVKAEKVTKVMLDYDAFDSISSYKEAVLNRIDDFKHPVSFIAQSFDTYESQEAMKAEFDRVSDGIVYADECMRLNHEEFNTVRASVVYNGVNDASMTVVITFYGD